MIPLLSELFVKYKQGKMVNDGQPIQFYPSKEHKKKKNAWWMPFSEFEEYVKAREKVDKLIKR